MLSAKADSSNVPKADTSICCQHAAHFPPEVVYCRAVSNLESIGHQIERLLDAFDGAREEALKLAVVENGMALLETRLWLADFKEAAIYCAELERLRAHQVSEPSADAFELFSRNLRHLRELGQPQFNSGLLAAVNEMRSVRDALRFDRATTLVQAERMYWREMHRRINVPRRLRRHMTTVIDLLEATQDSSKSERALPLLGREAGALKALFRFNPSTLVWGALHSLCALAHRAQMPISLARLKEYCEGIDGPSEKAKGLFAARPCLAEIASEIERLDEEHPIPGLLKASPEEITLGLAVPGEIDSQASDDANVTGAADALADSKSEIPAMQATSTPEAVEFMPVEAKGLAEAAENLAQQVEAGVLEETALIKDMQALAERVLGRVRERGENLAHYVEAFDHLCELIDLSASGVNVPESEFESLAADLQEYISGPKALRQIDDALTALTTLREHLARHPSGDLKTNLEEQEFEELLEGVTRIRQVSQNSQEAAATRLFGYLLVRGGLCYALRHREDMRIEPAGASTGNSRDKECEERLIEDLFPQSGVLEAPRQRLSFAEAGRRIGLACDEIRGPVWIDLIRRLAKDYGFARLTDGGSVCVLSPEILLLHCR